MSEEKEEWTEEDTKEYRRALLEKSREKQKFNIHKTLDGNTQRIIIEDKRLEQQRDRKDEENVKIRKFFEGARDKLISKLAEHDVKIPESSIQSMEDIQVFAGILKDYNEKGKGSSGKPTGTIPLASQNAGEDEGYDSMGEMITDIVRMSKERGLRGIEAKKVLRDLWMRKMPQAIEERKVVLKIPTDEQLAEGKGMKELINEEHRRKLKKRMEDDEN